MFKSQLDWSAYKDAGMGDAYADIPKHGGDYAKAIAACINSRQCEESGKQVMCPSFRVTGDKNLSTGGRVELLKSALNHLHDDQSQLLDKTLQNALDLCVSCKGCKRECENNVDMALIKSEFIAQRNTLQKISWRSKLFAHFPFWLHQYPRLKILIRLRNKFSMLRVLADQWFGISREVNLPEPQLPTTIQSLTPVTNKSSNENSPVEPLANVLLFVDTFSKNFDATIPLSAKKLLERAGYHIEFINFDAQSDSATTYCCGRTYLAQGMVEQARVQANRLINALHEKIEQGYSVVGLEASCVLGLRDDALALFSDQVMKDKIKAVSAKTVLLEEFIAREIKAKRFQLEFDEQIGNYFIHGHCHQKATGAMKSVRRVLKLLNHQTFTTIDSSCCGMAGSFGIESEHQGLSKKMAEQSLLPALRQEPSQAVIANGFSCRQQIANYAENTPLHLAQVLCRHMK